MIIVFSFFYPRNPFCKNDPKIDLSNWKRSGCKTFPGWAIWPDSKIPQVFSIETVFLSNSFSIDRGSTNRSWKNVWNSSTQSKFSNISETQNSIRTWFIEISASKSTSFLQQINKCLIQPRHHYRQRLQWESQLLPKIWVNLGPILYGPVFRP